MNPWMMLLALLLGKVPWERVFACIMARLEKKDEGDDKAKVERRIEEQRLAYEMCDSGNAEQQAIAREALEAWAAGKPTLERWRVTVRGEA